MAIHYNEIYNMDSNKPFGGRKTAQPGEDGMTCPLSAEYTVRPYKSTVELLVYKTIICGFIDRIASAFRIYNNYKTVDILGSYGNTKNNSPSTFKRNTKRHGSALCCFMGCYERLWI